VNAAPLAHAAKMRDGGSSRPLKPALGAPVDTDDLEGRVDDPVFGDAAPLEQPPLDGLVAPARVLRRDFDDQFGRAAEVFGRRHPRCAFVRQAEQVGLGNVVLRQHQVEP
jgi:hypothetical protein